MQRFHLSSSSGPLATLTFDTPGRRQNVFDLETFIELGAVIDELEGRRDIQCLVLLSGKPREFMASADPEALAAVEDPATARQGVRLGQQLFDRWEALPFATVAAIRGRCLGGGSELAMASTFRVVSDHPSTRIALPEVTHGILPGWGGCTRLPRYLGLADAFEMILEGRELSAAEAVELGFAEALLPEAGFFSHVRSFAEQKLQRARRLGAEPSLDERLMEHDPVTRRRLFDNAERRIRARSRDLLPAPLRALDVLAIAIENGEDAGLEAEVEAIADLIVSPQAKSLLYSEAAIHALEKGPAEALGVLHLEGLHPVLEALAGRSLERLEQPVRLVADDADALGAAVARLQQERREPPGGPLHPSLRSAPSRPEDLVIADGSLPASLGEAPRLSLYGVAEPATDAPPKDPGVRLHWVAPYETSRLVEVVVPAGAPRSGSDRSAAFAVEAERAQRWLRALDLVPLMVTERPGLVVDAIRSAALVAAFSALEAGHRVEEVDVAAVSWGFPLGPFALVDRLGPGHVAELLQRLPLPALPAVAERWIELQEDAEQAFFPPRRRNQPAPDWFSRLGLSPSPVAANPDALVAAQLQAMAHAAATCLDAGVVSSARQVDAALVASGSFPAFRGGICYWADAQGAALTDADSGQPFTNSALRRTLAAGGFAECFPSVAADPPPLPARRLKA